MSKFKNMDFNQKKEDLKDKINTKISGVKYWVCDNKEVIITLTPIVIGGLATVTKVVGKQVTLRKEKTLKDLYCYDRSLGHYWRLKRELSNKEWCEIDKRKQNGERLADILTELKILK